MEEMWPQRAPNPRGYTTMEDIFDAFADIFGCISLEDLWWRKGPGRGSSTSGASPKCILRSILKKWLEVLAKSRFELTRRELGVGETCRGTGMPGRVLLP